MHQGWKAPSGIKTYAGWQESICSSGRSFLIFYAMKPLRANPCNISGILSVMNDLWLPRLVCEEFIILLFYMCMVLKVLHLNSRSIAICPNMSGAI